MNKAVSGFENFRIMFENVMDKSVNWANLIEKT